MKGKILLLVLFSCMWVKGWGQKTINVDLSGSVTATATVASDRSGNTSCGGSNCVVFHITLNPGADLLGISCDQHAASNDYTVNCGPLTPISTPICLTGGATTVDVAFCKPGGNTITYTFTESLAVKASPDITVRQGCTGSMSVTGLDPATTTWTSIYPGAVGTYDGYLTCKSGCIATTVAVPVSASVPPYIDYKVSGNSTSCNDFKTATIRVYTVTPMTVAVSPATAAICGGAGGSVTLTATASGGSPPYTYSWTNSSGTVVGTAQSITVSSADTYTVNVADNISGCGPVPQSATVTASAIPVVMSPPSATICSGTAQNYALTSTVSGTTYSWSRDPVANISNAGVYSQTTNTITETLINTGTTPVQVKYIIVPTASGCTGSAFTYTVTVNPTPAITSAGSATLCNSTPQNYTINSNVSGATFTWSRAAVTGISNLAVSGQTSNTITETLVNTSNLPVTATYIITPSANGCSGAPFTYAVTVNPTPAITSAGSATICNNTAQNYTITSGVSGATFTWSRAAVTGISNLAVSGQTSNTITETLINTGNVPVAVTYTIMPSANGCGGASFPYTVTVNPTPTITSAGSATLCNNTPQNYNIIGSVSGTTFTWSRAAVAGISNGTVSGQTSSTITETLINTSNLPVTATYIITPSANGCSGAPFPYTVTVNPTAIITSAGSATICNNTALNYTITSNVPGAAFTWSRAAVAGISNGTVSGQTSNTITETLINTNNAPVTVTYSITPSFGGCNGTPSNYTVTVNPTPTITSASSATLCNNTVQNYSITSNVTGATFTWSRAAVTGIINGTVSGQTSNTITETLNNTSNAPVTVTYLITPSFGGCNGTTFPYTVTVNPTPAITSAGSATLCNSTPQNYTINSNVSGATFTWSRAAVAGISNTAVTAQTGNTISEVLNNTTSAPIDVPYIIMPSANGCSGPSFTYTLKVYPTATVTSASTGSICNNTAQNYTITSGISSPAFIWSRPAVTGISNNAVTLQTGNLISEALNNTTSVPIAVTYNILPVDLTSSCYGTPFAYTVTVNPTAIITSAPSASICNNTSPNYTIISNVSSATFTWSRSAVSGITNPGVTNQPGNTINETLTNTTSAPIDVVYTIVPSVGGCNGTPFTYTVAVAPTPIVNSAASAGTICNSTPLNYTITSNVTGATFTWSRAAITGISNGPVTNQSGSTITETLTNTTSAPIDVVYTIIPDIGGCSGPSFTYTVRVDPTAIITSPSTSAAICNNTSPNYTITSNVIGATFTWSRAAITGISNAPVILQAGNTISEILNNTTSDPIDVVYTIVPTIGLCNGTSFTYTVTVNPTPIVTSAASAGTVCNNTALNYAITSNVTGATFTWSRAAITGISNAAVTNQPGNTITETLTNTSSAPIDVNYIIVPSIGGCSGPSFTYTVRVDPTAIVTSPSTSAAICNNTSPNYTITSNVIGATFAWSRAAITGISNAPVILQAGNSITEILTNTTSAPIDVQYTIVPSVGNCAGTSFTYTVTVNPTPIVTSASTAGPICNSTALSYNITSNVIGATFTWSRAAIAGISNAPVTNQSGNTIAETLTNTSSAPIDVVYTIIPATGLCSGPSFTYTVRVNPTAKVTSPSTSSGPICNNTSPNYTILSNVSGATFTWSRAAITGISNAPVTDQPGSIITETLTNTTSAPIDVVYTIVPAIGSCAGTTFTYTVTVNPTPKVTSASSFGPICNNTTLNYTITSDVIGATFTWSRPAIIGISNGAVTNQPGNTISETLINTSSAPIGVIYTIVPSIGGCTGTSFTYTVTVNPTAKVISPSTSSGPICNNTSPNYTILSNVSGATFTWSRAAITGISNAPVTNQPGSAITETLTNTTSAPIDVVYTIVPAIGSCAGTSFTYTVTVNPTPIVTSVASAGPICNSTSPNYTILSNVTGATFTWSRAAITGISNAPVTNQAGNTINETLTNTTSTPIDVVYTIVPSIGSCNGPTFTYTVRVNPTATVTSVPTSSGPICNNTSPNYTITSDVIGATFTWSRPTIAGISNAPVTNQAGNTINEILTNTTSAPINVVYTIVPAIGSCAGTTFTYTVTVNPTPIVTSAASSGPICNSTSPNYTILSNVSGATFTWSRAAITGISNAPVTNQPGNTIAETLTNTTSAPIDVVYTIVPFLGSCDGPAFTYTVRVNPTATITSVPTSSGPICNNTSPNYTITSNVIGATFVWSRLAIPGISNLPVTQTGNLISETLTNTTSAPIDIVYTIVPSIGSCAGTSFTYTVTVNPTPKVTSAASSGTICNNTSPNYTILSDVAGATFTWSRAAITGISNAPATNQPGGVINETLTNTTSAPIDVVYTIVPAIGSCNGPSFTYTVRVNPTATVTSVPTSSGPICNNTSPNYTITSSVIGATFTWSRATIAGISNAPVTNQTGNVINEVLTNTTSAPISVVYTIVPAIGGCAGTSFTYMVTVNPTPIVTSAASSGPICNSTALNYTILSNVSGATFVWSRPAVTGISNGAVIAQAGNTITETLTNTTSAPIDVVYTIIPSIGTCSGTPFTYTVTVNPTAKVTSAASSAAICNNTAFNYTITSNVIGATFTWSRDAVAGISNAPVTNQAGNTIAETLINTTSLPVTVNYTIMPTANGCTGTSFTYTVVVNPTPRITSVASAIICNNTAQNYTIASNVSGATFAWSRAAVAGISNVAVPLQTGNKITESLNNTTSAPIDVTYEIMPTANGCPGDALFTYTVTLNPTATVSSPSSATICNNTAQNYGITSNVSGATFTWSRAAVAGISNAPVSSQSGNVIGETLNNTTSLPIVVSYAIVPTANGCSGTPFTYTVTVNPTALITSASSASICNNTAQNYSIASNVSGATFTWSRAAVAGISNAPVSSQTSSTITETLNNTTSAPIAVTYNIIPTANGCPGTATFTYTVTVNPTPIITSPSSATICNNTAQNYAITSNVSGATFIWSRPAVAGISNAPASLRTSNTITETLNNTTSSPIAVTYTVVATANGCSGPLYTYTVMVNPTSVITSASSATICNNTAQNYTITSNVTGATFTWTRAAVAGISNAPVSQTGNTITEILTNTTSAPITVSYNIIPTANGCPGVTSFTYNVTVQPTPLVTNSTLAQTVCSQSSTGPIVFQSNVSGTTFQWTATASPGIAGFVPMGTGNIPSKILLNADTVAGTVTYVVTPYNNGCSGTPVNYVITVNPKPITPVAGSNSPVCQNSPLMLTTTAVKGAIYSWIGPNGFISDQQNPVIASAGMSAAGTYTLFVTVNDCTSDAGTVKVAVVPTPSAPVVTSNGPLCQGSTLTLNASNITGATYNWTGPNGFTSNLQNPSIDNVTAANAGIYKVTATVNGCPSPAGSINVIVNEIPVAPTATSNSPVCKGSVLTLSVKIVPGYTYTWTGPNGFTSNQANPIIPVAAVGNAGTYYVTATSGGLCTGPAQAVNVVVNETPINPVALSNSPVCTGYPITLSASTFAGALYKWTGPNGYTSNLQNPVIDVAGMGCAGVYTVSITALGCSVTTTASTSVVVNQTPIAPTASSNSPVCVANDIQLSASGVAGASYFWTGPNGFTSTLQNPVIHNAAVTDSGTYKVTVTLNACSSAATSTKVVITRPVVAFAGNDQVTCANNPNISLAGTITGDNHRGKWTTSGSGVFLPVDTSLRAIYVPSAADIAAGGVSLTLSSTQNGGCSVSTSTMKVIINPRPIVNAGGNRIMCVYDPAININGSVKYAASGRWSTSGTGTFSPSNRELNVNYIPSAADRSSGSVKLTLTSLDNSNCFPVSDGMNLTILPSTNINMPNMLYIKQGDTKVIEPVVTGSAVEYSWSPGLYLSSAAVKTPTVKGVESQLYTLTVTGTAGCAVSKQIQINVLKPIVVPNTFTPNADGVNDVWVINELANYPGAEVSVYNRYGMKMFFSRGYGVPWDGTYQGKPVPFGTYYYVISLGIYGAPMSGYVAVVR